MEAAEVETRQLLQKLFPKVSLPSNMVREVALLNLLLGARELWFCCAGQSWSVSSECPLSQGFCSGMRVFLAGDACYLHREAKLQLVASRSVKTTIKKLLSCVFYAPTSDLPVCITLCFAETVNFPGWIMPAVLAHCLA